MQTYYEEKFFHVGYIKKDRMILNKIYGNLYYWQYVTLKAQGK